MTLSALKHSVDNDRTPSIYDVECTVKSNRPVNVQYRQLILDAPEQILNCEPGQFFHLLCPISGDYRPYLRRPMSIYGYYPEKKELHFLYKVIGSGTSAMSALVKGDSFTVLGPLGRGFDLLSGWKNLLLVARGVGLATLAPLALKARSLDRKLTAICSARSGKRLDVAGLFS